MLKLPTQYFHTCTETVSSFKVDPIGRAVGLSTEDVLPDFVFMKCVHTMCKMEMHSCCGLSLNVSQVSMVDSFELARAHK